MGKGTDAAILSIVGTTGTDRDDRYDRSGGYDGCGGYDGYDRCGPLGRSENLAGLPAPSYAVLAKLRLASLWEPQARNVHTSFLWVFGDIRT